MLYGFILGGYAMGMITTFIFVGFFCALGGRNEDMWKPFVYSILWPIMLPLFIFKGGF